MSTRRLSLRDRVFLCRARVSEEGLVRTQVSCGAVVLLHPAASLLLLSLEAKAATFLLPLLALCAEIATTSCGMVFVVVCDLFSHRAKTFSVWQREAVGRLLRNFFMGLMLSLSLLSVFASLDSTMRLTDHASCVLIPAVLTAGIGLLKVAVVHSPQSWFWGSLFAGSLVQMGMLVGKLDYQWGVEWPVVIMPLYVLILSLAVILILVHEGPWWRLVLRTLACGLGLMLCALQGFGGEKVYVLCLAWVCLFCVAVSSSEACGGYLLDIFWGHVEIDFNYRQSPVQLKRMHTF